MAVTIRDRVNYLRDNENCHVDDVVLHVDYQIIEHFSEHLYKSPNKAIEELVANGFDAFATEVQVFTPGQYTPDKVIVWDNGESMDVDGLKKLWWIARSPKANGHRIGERNGNTRKLIGKFGIGKLASYSVGQVISHVCRHNGDYYIVSIDYAEVRGDADRPPVSSENPVHAPIVRLNETQATELVTALFHVAPPTMDQMLREASWTFAVIERLKVDDLPQGRLMWVLGNGMPLRPDFDVRVNGDEVASKLDKKAHTNWDFSATEVTNAIRARWEDGLRSGEIGSEVRFGGKVGLDPANPGHTVPFGGFGELGQVWGHIRLFDDTLLKHRTDDQGRSHGFFLMVRGRLVNPDDDKFLLPDPSFQSFYRSQFVIHADDLDEKLLADRQGLREDAAVRQELGLLQKALASAARGRIETRDDEKERSESTKAILPVASRVYYRDPLNALLLRARLDRVSNFDPAGVRVERKPLGVDRPIAEVALEENAFHVNSLHPYYIAVEKRAGRSRAAREFLRTFDLFAISERLLEGHLLDIGIGEEYVSDVVAWREGLFKRLAASYDRGPKVIEEMHRTSHVGGRAFERALRDVFEDMGFAAAHDGSSGSKDVLVVASVGPESYRFTVEAKGSANPIRNEDADVSAAASHRDAAGAEHAVVVGRRFEGFGSKRDRRDAALYRECRATGGVSIIELGALERIHAAIVKFSYPLPLLRDVFMTLDTPREKCDRIEGLTSPSDGFNYRELLEEIWRRQGSTAEGDVVAYRAVYQDSGWKGRIGFEDFQCRLIALDTLAAGRIRMNTGAREVYLRQAPELVLAQIEKALYGDGHEFDE